MIETIAIGIGGGLLAQCAGIYYLWQKGNLPACYTKVAFWILFFLMVSSGGFLTFVYEISDIDLVPIVALNIGASAPLIFQRLGSFREVSTPE